MRDVLDCSEMQLNLTAINSDSSFEDTLKTITNCASKALALEPEELERLSLIVEGDLKGESDHSFIKVNGRGELTIDIDNLKAALSNPEIQTLENEPVLAEA